ncbi:MAG TPA: hypothetical protein VM409_01220 [Chloroflexia bacterium]|nr:hypothetical protein [Chloroflexia bacterium]
MPLKLRGRDQPTGQLWSGVASTAAHSLRERALWIALLAGLLAITLAYQRSVFADVGGGVDGLFTSGFHDPEQSGQANFRWSTTHSALHFPGIGKPLAAFPVQLQLSSGSRPGPARVEVAANGHPASIFTVGPQSAAYSLNIDPSWIDLSGNLRLDFSTPTFKPEGDKRDLGFIIDFARLDLPAGATLPSLPRSLLLLLSGIVVYIGLRACWLTPRATGLTTFLFLGTCAALIAFQRLLITTYTLRLLVALVLALVVGLLIEWLTRIAARAAGWHGQKSIPEWAWAGLRGLLMLSIALKVGGLLHPNAFIIDSPFHFRYINFMAEGKPWNEYFGESLALAVMPREEWGSARAFIPYSPFFYVVAAPLAWLPLPLDITVPAASALFDTIRIAFVFLIALALTGPRYDRQPRQAGLMALASAGLFAFVPATFLLQQWGNWPTQTSLWLLTFWAALTGLLWHRLTRPLVWLASTAILALTLLSYTVTAAYTGIFVGLLVVAGWLFAREDRRRWAALGGSLLASCVLALAIYYGQYVGKVLGETLPTFGQAIEEQGKLTTLRPSAWDFLTGHLAGAMQSYNLAIVYTIALAGALLYFASGGLRHRADKVFELVSRSPLAAIGPVPWQQVWLAVWLFTFPLFTLADFYVDQALKEFWYALPAVAVVGGRWMLALALKGKHQQVYTLLFYLLSAVLVWQSLSLWVFRLFYHNR